MQSGSGKLQVRQLSGEWFRLILAAWIATGDYPCHQKKRYSGDFSLAWQRDYWLNPFADATDNRGLASDLVVHLFAVIIARCQEFPRRSKRRCTRTQRGDNQIAPVPRIG